MASGIVESKGQESAQSGTSAAPSRSKMLQRLLDASSSLPAFIHDLLTTQAVVVAGTEAAAFLLERSGEDTMTMRSIAHIRPDESDAETRAAALRAFQNIVQPCVAQGKDGAIEIGGAEDGGEPQFCLVTLLRSEGQLVAVSAVITRARDLDRAKQRLTSMQLVAGYFELYTLRRYAEQAKSIAERHQHVLQFAAAVATSEGFDAAGMSLCNELATRMGASRVSLGWQKGKRIRVKALSHTEKFDKKQDLIVRLEEVMEECADQEEPVRYDPNGENSPNVVRCAKALSISQGGGAVLSVPLRKKDEVVGVLTAEFPPQQPVNPAVEGALVVASEVLAPALADRHENDRLILVKVGHSVANVARATFGPRYTLAKIIVLSVIGALAFVTLYSPMYRLRAPFQLAATQKRTVCAPFNGFIKAVHYKPGQAVKQGDLMVELDTTQLQLQLSEARHQARAKLAEARMYMRENKIGQYNVAMAEAAEAEERANLLQDQINQARLTAPLSGVVLGGDLTDRQGAPVELGQELFVVAEATSQRPDKIDIEAEIFVSERDIQDVWIGQKGKLATTSFPNREFGFVVKRIIPLGDQARSGENNFRVYAQLEERADWMFPGMAGESRLDVRERSLAWQWTHRLIDWIRLKFWV